MVDQKNYQLKDMPPGEPKKLFKKTSSGDQRNY